MGVLGGYLYWKVVLEFWFGQLKCHFQYPQNSQKHPKWPILEVLGGTKNGTSGARIKILRPLFNTNTPPKTPIWTLWEPFWTPEKWFLAILFFWSFSHWNSHWSRRYPELSFPWVKMLNSYIFVIRKQNATRNCNVLFKFLYFGFLAPPSEHTSKNRCTYIFKVIHITYISF